MLYRIHNILYQGIANQNIKEGDLVLDTKDNTYGVCDMVIDDKIAIKDGWVVELAVPMSRVLRLIPYIGDIELN